MKRKENVIIAVILVIMVIAIVGVSYAAFSFSQTGSKVNSITTGSITMTYTEDTNGLSLSGALPTTDKTGMVRLTEGEYFDFTVSSEINGDVNINYEISAKKEDGNTIDGRYIKLYLTKINDDGKEEGLMTPETYNEETSSNEYTGRPSNEMSLYTSSMNSSEENKYRLRMYVDESYNPQGDGGGLTFSVRVNVYGKAGDKMPVMTGPVSEVLLSSVGSNGDYYDDGTDTFITGEEPNNYIWYSGKLWRAVSVNNEAKTTKLVTQWNISAIPYSSGSTAFVGSYMEDWLNDTSVDGFLGNLRDYESFIVTDSKWNATLDATSLGSITRPSDETGTVVTDAVGLLNMYEYQTSYIETDYSNGYLNNGLSWRTLTPYSTSSVRNVNVYGYVDSSSPSIATGVRPSINLKSDVKIVSGDGTIDNPYRLKGDNDTNLTGTLLNTRFSGEYIRFGTGENNLYMIVSHETSGLTKITNAEPLKDSGTFKTLVFGDTVTFSSKNTIGTFLNGDYLTNYVGDAYSNMIEDSTAWYLGTVGRGTSYKLAKYTDVNGTSLTSSTTTAKVGLLRFGELGAGQYERYYAKGGSSSTGLTTIYWTLTPNGNAFVRPVDYSGGTFNDGPSIAYGVRPSLNLKSNVVITSGEGTKENPFEIQLGS